VIPQDKKLQIGTPRKSWKGFPLPSRFLNMTDIYEGKNLEDIASRYSYRFYEFN
jgi:hypothetical protein